MTLGQAIQQQLTKGSSLSAFIQKWGGAKNKDPGSFLELCQFLYLSGQNQLILKIALKQLKKKELLPWAFLMDILDQQKIRLSKEQRLLFLKGIKEQKQIPALLTWNRWDDLHPELKALKKQEQEQINRNNNAEFIKLMEDLHFIQAQGILQKEEDILKNLKTNHPENPQVQELWLKFQEKWGRHIIQKKKKDLIKKKLFPVPPQEKEKKEARKIARAISQKLKHRSESVYDMALFFAFLGYPLMALKILKPRADSPEVMWLYLDLLLEGRLYIDSLQFADTLTVRTKADPEAVFALSYARARAYYGLGQKERARAILSQLQEVRPHYRLTTCLLKQWEKEEP